MAGMDAFGTTLAYFDVSEYVPVARITSLSPPNVSRESLDVTAHDSPDGWMEFISGLKDGGDVSADINWLPEVDNAWVADHLQSKEAFSWQIETPDGETITFDGFVTSYDTDTPYDGKAEASLTIKVTGPVVFASAGS